MDIDAIRTAFDAGTFQYRVHARRQMLARMVSNVDLGEVIASATIIEEYPHHVWGPCCLLYGTTQAGRHLHLVLAPPPSAWIITVYEPDPNEWIDYRVRRQP